MARSTRRRRPAPSREQILEAAEALFAERGFWSCPLRDLISTAGCSTTAFYARFPDKEAVLADLVAQVGADLLEAAGRELADAPDVAEGVARTARLVPEVLVPRKGMVRVMLTEGLTVEPARARIRDAHTLLAHQVAAWLHAPEDPRALNRGWAVVGAIHLQLMRWAVYEDVTDAELSGVLRDVAGAALRRLAGA